MGTLDGSEMGFRFLHYQPSITGPELLPLLENLSWGGNVASLRRHDFRSFQSAMTLVRETRWVGSCPP